MPRFPHPAPASRFATAPALRTRRPSGRWPGFGTRRGHAPRPAVPPGQLPQTAPPGRPPPGPHARQAGAFPATWLSSRPLRAARLAQLSEAAMPGPDSPPVTIVDVRDDDFRLVPEFYRTVIVPNFAPGELQTEAELMSGLRSGRSRVLIAVAAGGAMLGGAVGDFFPRSNVMLLSYLVVLGAGRGQGIGATVLQAAKQAWTEE